MVLAVGQGRLDRFRDIKIHPVVRNTVNQIDVATDVNADVSAAGKRPGVGTVIGRGVG